jgi:ribosomal protein L11 methyltransferase
MRTWPALRVSGLAALHGGHDTTAADLLQATLLEHPVSAVEELSTDEWRVYFPSITDRDRASLAIRDDFPTLTLDVTEVPDDDWAAKSQASLRAIAAGRIIVAPPWDTDGDVHGDASSDALETVTLVIQPSMGFGTGHHATTRLCLLALQRLPLAGRRVLDVGTGSGVLAIAASRLGAAEVTAIDDDPDAVQAARENLTLNPGAAVDLQVTDLRTFDQPPFALIVANLTGGLLASAAARLEALTAPGGVLVLSGLLRTEADEVLAHFTGSTVTSRATEDEWVCAVLERRPPA